MKSKIFYSNNSVNEKIKTWLGKHPNIEILCINGTPYKACVFYTVKK
jgi:hypothetical protein